MTAPKLEERISLQIGQELQSIDRSRSLKYDDVNDIKQPTVEAAKEVMDQVDGRSSREAIIQAINQKTRELESKLEDTRANSRMIGETLKIFRRQLRNEIRNLYLIDIDKPELSHSLYSPHSR